MHAGISSDEIIEVKKVAYDGKIKTPIPDIRRSIRFLAFVSKSIGENKPNTKVFFANLQIYLAKLSNEKLETKTYEPDYVKWIEEDMDIDFLPDNCSDQLKQAIDCSSQSSCFFITFVQSIDEFKVFEEKLKSDGIINDFGISEIRLFDKQLYFRFMLFIRKSDPNGVYKFEKWSSFNEKLNLNGELNNLIRECHYKYQDNKLYGSNLTLEHLKIERFHQEIIKFLDRLVSVHIKTLKEIDLKILEILSHVKYGQRRNKIVIPRDKFIKQAINSLQSNRYLIVCGEAATGKTSFMANLAQEFEDEECVIALRFAGVPESSFLISNVLKSISFQLHRYIKNSDESVKKMHLTNNSAYSDSISSIETNLAEIIKKVSNENPEKKFIIMLDSLDSLYSDHAALQLNWLPIDLPQNFKFILSTINRKNNGDEHPVYKRICEIFKYNNMNINEIEIKNFEEQEIKIYFENINKYVPDILTNFKSISPLCLKVISEENVKKIDNLANDKKQNETRLLAVIFENLERKYSKYKPYNKYLQLLVALITLSEHGLTLGLLVEIFWKMNISKKQQLINANDNKINEKEQLQCLLLHLIHDLKKYLAIRRLRFNHRKIKAAALFVCKRWYNEDQLRGIYEVLYDYFTTYRHKAIKDKPYKLRLLPTFLIECKNLDLLTSNHLLQLDFIVSKCTIVGFQECINDFEKFFKAVGSQKKDVYENVKRVYFSLLNINDTKCPYELVNKLLNRIPLESLNKNKICASNDINKQDENQMILVPDKPFIRVYESLTPIQTLLNINELKNNTIKLDMNYKNSILSINYDEILLHEYKKKYKLIKEKAEIILAAKQSCLEYLWLITPPYTCCLKVSNLTEYWLLEQCRLCPNMNTAVICCTCYENTLIYGYNNHSKVYFLTFKNKKFESISFELHNNEVITGERFIYFNDEKKLFISTKQISGQNISFNYKIIICTPHEHENSFSLLYTTEICLDTEMNLQLCSKDRKFLFAKSHDKLYVIDIKQACVKYLLKHDSQIKSLFIGNSGNDHIDQIITTTENSIFNWRSNNQVINYPCIGDNRNDDEAKGVIQNDDESSDCSDNDESDSNEIGLAVLFQDERNHTKYKITNEKNLNNQVNVYDTTTNTIRNVYTTNNKEKLIQINGIFMDKYIIALFKENNANSLLFYKVFDVETSTELTRIASTSTSRFHKISSKSFIATVKTEDEFQLNKYDFNDFNNQAFKNYSKICVFERLKYINDCLTQLISINAQYLVINFKLDEKIFVYTILKDSIVLKFELNLNVRYIQLLNSLLVYRCIKNNKIKVYITDFKKSFELKDLSYNDDNGDDCSTLFLTHDKSNYLWCDLYLRNNTTFKTKTYIKVYNKKDQFKLIASNETENQLKIHQVKLVNKGECLRAIMQNNNSEFVRFTLKPNQYFCDLNELKEPTNKCNNILNK